jgi:thioredoxin 1
MSNVSKVAIVIALIAAVVVVVSVKQMCPCRVPQNESPSPASTASTSPVAAQPVSAAQSQPAALPHLVDLGSKGCIPCDMLAPILDQLKQDFAGRLEVTFYDVRERPDIGRSLGVRVIPTQIFFDAKGRELFRHEGFMAKADILNKWKALGVDLQGQGP